MEKRRRAVVAVGGNSLISDSGHESIPDQFTAVITTSRHIADMVEDGWDTIVTHGNGPQVGFILRRSELAIHEVSPVPMDYAGADIQGAVGYMFQKALRNELKRRGMNKQVATVVTQTRIDSSDPAFDDPSKPIGSYMDEETAGVRASEQGWIVREDAGRGWRRVVPSPQPVEIVELQTIKAMQDLGVLVVCCGGGGIPVVEDENGDLQGVEAVIDKDFASS
ncbi:MAG: carbamate kinase, partial [Spirochaetales bacterium]|nr:carbamate kinase [Spirochaetales bacterium]